MNAKQLIEAAVGDTGLVAEIVAAVTPVVEKFLDNRKQSERKDDVDDWMDQDGWAGYDEWLTQTVGSDMGSYMRGAGRKRRQGLRLKPGKLVPWMSDYYPLYDPLDEKALMQELNAVSGKYGVFFIESGHTETTDTGEILIPIVSMPVHSSKSFLNRLHDVLIHEEVHQQQIMRAMEKPDGNLKMHQAAERKTFDKRGQIDTKSYLSIPQEIMAYAKSAVNEWVSNGISKDRMLGMLRSPGKTTNNYLSQYARFFGPGSPELKKFLKCAVAYVEELPD